jgi:predicted GTPase
LTREATSRTNFAFFTSSRSPKAKLRFSYERYLTNRLREEFGFFATPIRIKQRRKQGEASQSR